MLPAPSCMILLTPSGGIIQREGGRHAEGIRDAAKAGERAGAGEDPRHMGRRGYADDTNNDPARRSAEAGDARTAGEEVTSGGGDGSRPRRLHTRGTTDPIHLGRDSAALAPQCRRRPPLFANRANVVSYYALSL